MALLSKCREPSTRTLLVTKDVFEQMRENRTAYDECSAKLTELMNWHESVQESVNEQSK